MVENFYSKIDWNAINFEEGIFELLKIEQNITYFWPLTSSYDLSIRSMYIVIVGWTCTYSSKLVFQESLKS